MFKMYLQKKYHGSSVIVIIYDIAIVVDRLIPAKL
jgi:hypothetical protein